MLYLRWLISVTRNFDAFSHGGIQFLVFCFMFFLSPLHFFFFCFGVASSSFCNAIVLLRWVIGHMIADGPDVDTGIATKLGAKVIMIPIGPSKEHDTDLWRERKVSADGCVMLTVENGSGGCVGHSFVDGREH